MGRPRGVVILAAVLHAGLYSLWQNLLYPIPPFLSKLKKVISAKEIGPRGEVGRASSKWVGWERLQGIINEMEIKLRLKQGG